METTSIGGYRLLRKLGEGPRAEVFLAHPDRSAPDGGALPVNGGVAVKVFRASTSGSSVLTEIEALSAAQGAHVVVMMDAATAPSGRAAVILGRLSGRSLGELLASRERLTAGEAVTALAPIANTVRRLHRAGVAHGALRLESVRFDERGAPMLACFGAATLVGSDRSDAALAMQSAVAHDVAALDAIALAVLDRVESTRTLRGLQEWLSSPPADVTPERPLRLEENLFELAAGEPITFDREAAGSRVRQAVTPRSASTVVTARATTSDHHASRTNAALLPGLSIPAWLEPVLAAALSALPLDRLRAAIATVRPRFWVTAGAAAIALAIALLVVPDGGSDADAVSSTPDEPAVPPTPAVLIDDTPSRGGGDPTATDSTAPPDAVAGDDPIAAAVALLDARDRCIRDLSVLCLDDVDQAGSSAMVTDKTLIEAMTTGDGATDTVGVPDVPATLLERLGDSALVSLGVDSEPASLLLMKGEAGWRIRDYISP